MFSLLVLGLLPLSCGSGEIDAAVVVEEKVRERVNGFRNNFIEECHDKVIAAAQQKADSLLIERARRMRVIAGRPPRPHRPGTPPPMELEEALPLRPLFPFEIRFDTILRDSLYQDSLRLDSLYQLQLDSLRLDSLMRGLNPSVKPRQND